MLFLNQQPCPQNNFEPRGNVSSDIVDDENVPAPCLGRSNERLSARINRVKGQIVTTIDPDEVLPHLPFIGNHLLTLKLIVDQVRFVMNRELLSI